MPDKYTMFKNYMHNELGITKEDIRRWVEGSVREVAQEHLRNHFNTEQVSTELIRKTVQDSAFLRMVGSQLLGKIELKIKEE